MPELQLVPATTVHASAEIKTNEKVTNSNAIIKLLPLFIFN